MQSWEYRVSHEKVRAIARLHTAAPAVRNPNLSRAAQSLSKSGAHLTESGDEGDESMDASDDEIEEKGDEDERDPA